MYSPKFLDRKPGLALIAGPTASGKSDLAVGLAKALENHGKRGVVINADSAQVYADLEVVSARPSPEDMQGVEHTLFGTWDGANACSAADWAETAKREIAKCHDQDAMPILCGGTGLYLRTLIEGIAPVPEIDPDIRKTIRSLPVAEAYAALRSEDPDRAAVLDPADSQRISRALEVRRSTGRTLAEWQAEKTGGIAGDVELHPAILLPPRAWLYERCDRRFVQMMEEGAVGEVEALLARNLDPALPVMRAIGVREIARYIQGHLSRDEAIVAGQAATRQYAKRQFTWFRRQPPAEWLRVESESFSTSDIFVSIFPQSS